MGGRTVATAASCNLARSRPTATDDNTSVYQSEKGNYEEAQIDDLFVVPVGSSPAGERCVDTPPSLD